MRKLFLDFTLALAVILMASGCDFFRVLAGRPTSAVIEAKTEAIRQKEEADRQKEEAARLQAALDAAGQAEEEEKPGTDKPDKPGKKRFYVIMASFSSAENASKYAERLSSKGYQAELFGFKGGYTGVGICGTDDEQEAKASLKEIKRQDFCPEGVWIIDRNKR